MVDKIAEDEPGLGPRVDVITRGAKFELGVCKPHNNATLTISTEDGRPVLQVDMGAKELVDLASSAIFAAARLCGGSDKAKH